MPLFFHLRKRNQSLHSPYFSGGFLHATSILMQFHFPHKAAPEFPRRSYWMSPVHRTGMPCTAALSIGQNNPQMPRKPPASYHSAASKAYPYIFRDVFSNAPLRTAWPFPEAPGSHREDPQISSDTENFRTCNKGFYHWRHHFSDDFP